tara:strand:+ start:76 stop:261 length:186 start_codon:yes stop_codon:yes gene_type:complete
MDNQKQLDLMSELLRIWCTSEKLEVICASDLLYGSDYLTLSQKDWLENYIMLWDLIEEGES